MGEDPSDAESLSASLLGQHFAPIFNHRNIALAVSGGADSVALMHLIAECIKKNHSKAPGVVVLTVDHGLRAEAADEVRLVAKWAANYDFQAQILVWKGEKPERNIQEAAREARYQQMLDYCVKNQVTALLTAHHLDDQAETVLMRLSRGSGVDGLSAIPPASHRSGVEILRPLINVPKSRLVKLLEDAQKSWICDPSNENDDYERVRLRKIMSELQEFGLTKEHLGRTAKRMHRTRQALSNAADRFLGKAATLYEAGYCEVDSKALAQIDEEIALRALAKILQTIGAPERSPRLSQLEELYHELIFKGRTAMTLAHCHITSQKTKITVVRELRADAPADIILPPGAETLWDRRFMIQVPANARSAVTVRYLGQQSFFQYRDQIGATLPPLIAASIVSFWREEKLLAVPHLNFYADGQNDGPAGTRYSATFQNYASFPSIDNGPEDGNE